MSVHLTISLTETAADLITGYSSGAKLYLESATTEGGSYSAVTNTALVSGTEIYEFWDVNGASSTWYKSRAGNSGGTVYGAYSAAFQATSLAAYASLMDLRESMDLHSTDKDNHLLDLLRDGKDYIDSRCHRTFLRVPQVSGDVTVYVDVVRDGMTSLVLASMGGYTTNGRPLDIISVTSMGIRSDESVAAYTTIAAGDTGYYLDGGDGIGAAGTDWPYEDISLSPHGTNHTTYPLGKRAVKLVCALGFPVIPRLVRGANLDWARDEYRRGPGGGSSTTYLDTPDGVRPIDIPTYVRLTAKGSPYVRRTFANI